MANLMATDINQTRQKRIAVKRIEGFAQEFGEKHRDLIRHAAFPLVLTPDLLYQIWANFVPEAPWTAVAHVLLSRLCRQVGYEMYEMDISDRNLLLRELKDEFGQERFDELADFIFDYATARLSGDDADTQDLRSAQEWTALAYTKPHEAARSLAFALNAKLIEEDMGEVLRLTALVKTLNEPLKEAGFEPLLIYSRGLESFARGDLRSCAAQLEEIETTGNQIQIGDISLIIPQKIIDEKQKNEPKQEPPILDLKRFFPACNPSKPLDMAKNDRQYYIDFSSVRSASITAINRTISRISPNKPTCQLFTAQIGAGKSTELLRLKAELEQENFHVIYFESSRVLDMSDVDVSDILLGIAGEVSESLEALKIRLEPTPFVKLFQEIINFLETPIELKTKADLSVGIGKITAKTKQSPQLRRRLRDYLQPQTLKILSSINHELLEPATLQLKALGKKGLVVIVDNLNRVSTKNLASGRSLPEYLFIDRGEQLRGLNCHLVYTIPFSLIFSNDSVVLQQRLGGGVAPQVLPMIPVRHRSGQVWPHALELIRQMVLARAFPEVAPEQRLDLVTQLFDSGETLDRLCLASGGHVRNLLQLVFDCLKEQHPPFNRNCVELVIKKYRDRFSINIDSDEWELIFQVILQQRVRGETEDEKLLRSLYIFEYFDSQGRWFAVNPLLAETQIYQSWLNQTNIAANSHDFSDYFS